MTMQCVILAGGLGTRLRSLGLELPKALIPISGEPFAAHQLALLKQNGIAEIVYCIGHRGDQIRAFAGDGSAWGLKISYVDEGDRLRGTAGALRLAFDCDLLASAFFVLYGDSYLPIEYRSVYEAYEAQSCPALMTILRNENRWDTSNVLFVDGRVLYDKKRSHPRRAEMRHIDYGLSVLDRNVVRDRVPPETICDLAELFHDLSEERQLAGFEVHERFYEVGSLAGIRDLELYLAHKESTNSG
jgi:prepilin-type processing-associated H-X9-DG protein